MNHETSKKLTAPASISHDQPQANASGWFRRSRSLHWLALAAALASLTVAAVWMWAAPSARTGTILQGIDIGLGLLFAAEFFTRTGWQQSRLTYLKWRWFDVIAIAPITVLGPLAVAPVLWIVFGCRTIRLADRILGDGFVQRKAIAVMSIAEEELSDRVLVKMLARWERELVDAEFGTAMAAALSRNKKDVLARIYADQLQEGTFAKLAHFTGLQAAIEKEEARLFGALIEMVGSPEVDAAIRDVIASSLRRSREQLGAQDWRRKLSAPTPVVPDETTPRPAVIGA